jgi:hypothetical protein
MKVLVTIGILLVIGFLFVCFSPTCTIIRSFDNFERNAKKVITGSELAAWGNALLQKYPTNATLTLRDLGTDFPPQLRTLVAKELGPRIVVYEPLTNQPPWVMVYWSSGFLGECGFEIGPTNFTGSRAHNRWYDGVYSWTYR